MTATPSLAPSEVVSSVLPEVCIDCLVETGQDPPSASRLVRCVRHATPPHQATLPLIVATDLQVIATLRAQLLDEMERLASEEELFQSPGAIIPPDRMQAASALCMKGLHYQLVQYASSAEVTEWVEQTLDLLHALRATTTRLAYRDFDDALARWEAA